VHASRVGVLLGLPQSLRKRCAEISGGLHLGGGVLHLPEKSIECKCVVPAWVSKPVKKVLRDIVSGKHCCVQLGYSRSCFVLLPLC